MRNNKHQKFFKYVNYFVHLKLTKFKSLNMKIYFNVTVAKAATRINHTAADELRRTRKALAPHVRDLVQDQNREAVRGAVRVPLLVHGRDRNRVPDLDLHLDLDLNLDLDLDLNLEAFQDREAGQHLDRDQDQPKVDPDRNRARGRAVRDQGPTVVQERVDRRQDQGQVQGKAVLDQDRRAVRERQRLVRDQDPEVVHAQVRKSADPKAKVDHDLNRSLLRGPYQDREALVDRDHDLDRKVDPEAVVQADQHGKCFYLHSNILLMII